VSKKQRDDRPEPDDDLEAGWVDVDLDGNPIEADGSPSRRAKRPKKRRNGRLIEEPADDDAPKPDPRDEGEEPGIAGMRVIGGSLKHRRITYSGDLRTRPMKDRVREALFNLIGPPVVGSLVIDLFAGTGALGIEALSRGAVGAVFFEKHFPTADVIKENIKTLGLEDRAEVIGCDSFLQWRRMRRDKIPLGAKIPSVKYAATAAAAEAGEGAVATSLPWVVFCSPPYDFFIERQAEMLKLIEEFLADMPPQSVFIVEADERFDLDLLPEAEEWTTRTYKPAVVALRHFDLAEVDAEDFADERMDGE
jgi:16S rRNA (guanine966-N2)-methyltransferase